MIRGRTVGYRALLAFAPLLTVAPAAAQAPQASPVAQEKAAAKKAGEPGKSEGRGDKAGQKGDDKPGRTDNGPGKADDKAGEPTVPASDRRDPDDPKFKDRMQRRRHQQDAERAKIGAAMHGQPMSEAIKEEMHRHARRIARLERIKALAEESKDTAVVERVTKLIEKENARHDKFMAHVEGKGDDKGKDDKGKGDDKGKDDKGKDDKGKDDKGKDEKGGVK